MLYINKNIKLIVFDMAGTTINEKGLVYSTLYNTIKEGNINIQESEMKQWHGINKREVIKHFVEHRYQGEIPKEKKLCILNENFNKSIQNHYFNKNNSIELINPELPNTFENLRLNGVKIALNTGYTYEIQEEIIYKLGMRTMIDGYISSQGVNYGRPYPYMIYHLMEQFNVKNPQQVIKVGDTNNDILEGHNAHCNKSVGVLSGAGTLETFQNADADFVIKDATCIKFI